MSPSDLRGLSESDLQCLQHYMHVISARERLEYIQDTACAFSGEEESREHRVKLAETAYRDDPEQLVRAIVFLNRR